MTRQEMIDYITQQIQMDSKLILLIRVILTNNLGNATDQQLQNLVNILQGS